jgi:hypothetical protein
MEMHSDNLCICLDIDKCAFFFEKFAMKYLFRRKKSNVIFQHFNIKGLSVSISKIHKEIPSSVDILVLFQHPSPQIDTVIRDVLIQGAMHCCLMCIRNMVQSIHFIYDWHANRNSWKINKLKMLIMHQSSLSILSELIFSDN